MMALLNGEKLIERYPPSVALCSRVPDCGQPSQPASLELWTQSERVQEKVHPFTSSVSLSPEIPPIRRKKRI
jgi:hypothetical protein